VQDEALARRPSAPAPVPSHSAHDRLSAHHGGRRPGGCPANHAPHRSANHHRVLRSPRPRLPPPRHRPPRHQPPRAPVPAASCIGDGCNRCPRTLAHRCVCRTLAARLRAPHERLVGRRRKRPEIPVLTLVGARGFEPPASCSQSRRATRLRYAPDASRRVSRSQGILTGQRPVVTGDVDTPPRPGHREVARWGSGCNSPGPCPRPLPLGLNAFFAWLDAPLGPSLDASWRARVSCRCC
jgi:hypothetical protein